MIDVPALEALRIMRIHLGAASDFIQYAKGAANDGGHAEYSADIDACATHADSLIVEIDAAIATAEERFADADLPAT
jgi:hypothetical protein